MQRRSTPAFWGFLTWVTCFYTIIGYVLGYTLYAEKWWVHFWLLLMPVAMFLLLFLVFYWFFVNIRNAWWVLAVVAIGWPFWQRTVGWHEAAARHPQHNIRVVSFNVTSFDAEGYQRSPEHSSTEKLIRYVAGCQADILCLQEFYEQPRNEKFQVVEALRKAGYSYFQSSQQNERSKPLKFENSVAIFSKFPIIKRGTEGFPPHKQNGLVWADIQVGNTTLRVVNVHLSSMAIRVGRVIKNDNLDSAKRESKSIVRAMRLGMERHTTEIGVVEPLLKNSPHLVILAGDFNEVPTGISYGRIRKLLKNSFEERGSGLGFTLNRSPYLVRIDNVFSNLLFLSHRVRRDVLGSDHYPVETVLALPTDGPPTK